MDEKSKIPFSYMLYAYSVKRAYRGTNGNGRTTNSGIKST